MWVVHVSAGEESVTRESFVSICWRLIPYWLNNWCVAVHGAAALRLSLLQALDACATCTCRPERLRTCEQMALTLAMQYARANLVSDVPKSMHRPAVCGLRGARVWLAPDSSPPLHRGALQGAALGGGGLVHDLRAAALRGELGPTHMECKPVAGVSGAAFCGLGGLGDEQAVRHFEQSMARPCASRHAVYLRASLRSAGVVEAPCCCNPADRAAHHPALLPGTWGAGMDQHDSAMLSCVSIDGLTNGTAARRTEWVGGWRGAGTA